VYSGEYRFSFKTVVHKQVDLRTRQLSTAFNEAHIAKLSTWQMACKI